MTGADDSGEPDEPTYRRLRRSEFVVIGVLLLIGVAIPVLWMTPIAKSWPLAAGAVIAFGLPLLPVRPRTIGFLLIATAITVGIVGALLAPPVLISWFALCPSCHALGGHVRAIRERR